MTTQTEEIWIEMIDFPKYEISNFGRVRSNVKDARILKFVKNHKGYYLVRVYKNKKQYTFSVHRLVCSHFNGDRRSEKGLQVNHINGDKNNNRADNLNWMTNQENAIHAFELGLRKAKKGEDNYKSKLTEEKIHKIVEILNTTELSCSKIGKMFEVSGDCIYDLVRGKSWKHLNLKINRGKNARKDVL